MWKRPERSAVAAIACGAAAFLGGLVAGLSPPPEMDVNGWAVEERVVSAESGSPHPGRWNEALVPYLAEIQAVLSDRDHRDVTVVKSGQTGFSEAGLNLIGASIDRDPCPILVVLPTIDEAKKYNKIKLGPTIDATPALRRKVLKVKSRDADSSTATTKRFQRGFLVLTGANAAAGLQMISARKIVFEEISGYPPDAGGRGDPVDQALTRSKAWLAYAPKRYYVSTPNIVGACRVTDKFATSDQRRYYVPCPQCGTFQVLRFVNLKWGSDTAPHGAYFVCAAHGCVIEPHHRRAMIAAGVWVKTYAPTEAEAADGNAAPPETIAPERLDRWRHRPSTTLDPLGRERLHREPGFHIWQAYSPFVEWDDTVAEWLAARGRPLKQKVFWQQALGEPWEERGEAPAAERLHEAREAFAWRRVPHGALVITAFVDVQGDRLEYGVYAWSRGLDHGWHIDGGIIAGDPGTDLPWRELDDVLARTYDDGRGNAWDIDALGIDAGYLSNRVYGYCRRHTLPRQAREPHNPPTTRHVFACDGRAGWKLHPVGVPSAQAVDFGGRRRGTVRLWPIGTFDMKSEIYTALRNLIAGRDDEGNWTPPALHFGQRCDVAFFEQITAEHLEDVVKRGGATQKEWVNPQRKRNEQLDIAVGARALAHHLTDSLTESAWAAHEARRAQAPKPAQAEFPAVFDPSLGAPVPGGRPADRSAAVRDRSGGGTRERGA